MFRVVGFGVLLLGCGHANQRVMEASLLTQPTPKVEAILSKMTLEEKVGQMAQITLDVITEGDNVFSSDEPLKLDLELVREAILDHKLGSIINTANNRARTPEKWNEIISQIQDIAVNESRLGIPIIYGIDAIHGATYTAGATFFPQEIGMAATWNPDLVKSAAEITAYETRASGIPWNFSPVLDLGRDPRFPRMWETFGEDVYLATEMGRQMIIGYQGIKNDVSQPYKVAATLKHFLGYSVPYSGKDRTPAYIPEMELRERHLPVFKGAIDAGAKSVMINSGLINGMPVHASKNIITDLLKRELQFTGVVVTDWKDIDNLHSRDKVASSPKEAVKIAINAGIDMSMIPYDYDFCKYLIELVEEGEVSMTRIDDAVRRILTFKDELGLFEHPTTKDWDYSEFGSKEHETIALKAAEEMVTLLKNDNILPLKKGARLLVTGPNANSMRSLNGGWSYSWQGEKVEEFASKYHTILEALQIEFGESNVIYEPGVQYKEDGNYWQEEEVNLSKVSESAKSVDYVVLCLGENSYTEKPGDLHDLNLSASQQKLAKLVTEIGKPVILVLNEGRPRLIHEIEPSLAAVVQLYLPGNFGGDALANVLSGEVNPSGKLPYTYPMFSNTLVTYDHKPSEEQNKMEGMYDYESDYAIQYPFGFGLSYTTFEYADLQLSDVVLEASDDLTVSVKVSNTGQVEGKEVVKLYISDRYASVTPDVKRLRRFEKVSLAPGETKTVKFQLSMEDLAFVGHDLNWQVEEGEFGLEVGGLHSSFELTETKKFKEVSPIF
ncbi:MAG: beta-glucosidase [Flammeovirgaceae bacterium]|nr:beta-glucosidase [Flammeovirgaceae bacterium]MBR07519.1 beta-glucosidase [Rickettsiales bacterium]HCX24301.1 beta-glucosidase [Cytophagales bacterium]|tara:strand:+ start:1765 stop:4104 length:2340 start_codon:yes stop_codon:yes gene_type:complete